MLHRFVFSVAFFLLIVFVAFSESLSYQIPDGFIKRIELTVKVTGGSNSVSLTTDSGMFSLRIEGRKANEIDDIHGESYRISLLTGDNQIIAEKTVNPSESSSFPIRLIIDRKRTLSVVTSGQKSIFNYADLGTPVAGSEIILTTDSKSGITFSDCNIDVIPPAEFCDMTVQTDSDSNAVVWTYLDCTTPKSGGVIIGGKYQLEIQPDSEVEGGYIAIYRGGSTIESQSWSDGAIKARLSPTHFDGHFDVEWYDAGRAIVTDEATATFQGDNLLTIEFPVLESTIRFSRSLNE